MMRYGVLLDSFGSPLSLTINKAIRMFHQVHKNLEPCEVHFSPGDCPIEDAINGLVVYADERLQRGRIRVTTRPMTFAEELEAEKMIFAKQVSQLAA